MRSRPEAGSPWLDVAPLLSRGALTLGFAMLALLLQVIALLIPGIVAALLLLVFAAFVALDGALAFGFLWFGGPVGGQRTGLLVRGVVAIGVTIVTLLGPIVAGEPWARLATLLAAWAVLNGALDVIVGWSARGGTRQHWLIVVGAVSAVVGVFLLVSPPSGMGPLIWWIAGYGVLYGGVTLMNAWRSTS